jgi:hypothetical protein
MRGMVPDVNLLLFYIFLFNCQWLSMIFVHNCLKYFGSFINISNTSKLTEKEAS